VSWIGARLPLLLGAYAVYIGPVVAIAKAQSLGAAAGAMLRWCAAAGDQSGHRKASCAVSSRCGGTLLVVTGSR